ncbi:MAG: hypothetical protein PUD92_00015 [Clostridiales bacterium]|nr:hypothetical protein [Clostridiales bacterium]
MAALICGNYICLCRLIQGVIHSYNQSAVLAPYAACHNNRIVDARRNDSVSAVVALQEFRELYPNLKVNAFLSDAASDNYATYKLLNKWDINAVISLNKTNKDNFKYPASLSVNENGAPIGQCNKPMVNWGFSKDRCRIKYRCPLA